MRITKGTREIYPTGGKLANWAEEVIILTIKLRLCGGVRDAQNQDQTMNTRSGKVQEINEKEKMEEGREDIDNWDRLLQQHDNTQAINNQVLLNLYQDTKTKSYNA